jgi:uncharacterized protein YukE
MAKAVADPEELRRFAQALKKFNAGVEGALSQLQAQAVSLGQTWRDQEHAKFQAEFEQTVRQLQRFVEASGEHIPVLLRKAEKLEEYLRQR